MGCEKIEIKNTEKGIYVLTHIKRKESKEKKLESKDYPILKELGDYIFGRDFSEFPETPVFDYFTS